MAWVEEVYKNGDKWYGAHTGKEYAKSETEKVGSDMWSKPSHCQPGEIVLEIEEQNSERN